MNTKSPQGVVTFCQWGVTPPARRRFLLAAVAVTSAISPPSVSVVKSTPAPTITTQVSPSILVRSVPVWLGETRTITGKGRAARVLLYSSQAAQTPPGFGVTYDRVVTTFSVVHTNRRKSAQLVLAAAPPPAGSVFPAPVSRTKDVLVPTVDVMSFVPAALQDDGMWPVAQIFMKQRSLVPFALDQTPPTVNPPALAKVKTVLVPAVSVSINTQVAVPTLTYSKAALNPTVVIAGAPILAVPTIGKVKMVLAPSIKTSNFGVNPPVVNILKLVLAPTVRITRTKQVKRVGRNVTEPKLAGATTEVKPPFDFSSYLSVGEAILSATIIATVYSGMDASPSAILQGQPSIDGNRVRQMMTGGVKGCIYELLCSVETSLGQTLELASYYYVEPNLA